MPFYVTAALIFAVLTPVPSVVMAKPGAAKFACKEILLPRKSESVLVLGGGRGGALAPSLIEGLGMSGADYVAKVLTASRGAQEPWSISAGHRSGIDRNDQPSLRRLFREEAPSLIMDAAGAHMNEAYAVRTIDEARLRGAGQARVLTDYLLQNPSARLIFISSQWADPAMKDGINVAQTFAVVGMPEPVSLRLYAELKSGFEEELLRFRRNTGTEQIVILRLGTLLAENYRAQTAQKLIENDGEAGGKNFTPAAVLSQAVHEVVRRLHAESPLPALIEVSSKNNFAGPKALGLRPESLKTYASDLKRKWQP